MITDDELRDILTRYRRIAVVGCSRDKEKDAHRIPRYLKQQGYQIIPVNPSADRILGEKAYRSLKNIPSDFDIVQIFRPSKDVPSIVDEAIATGKPKVIWMQLGIRNDEAARRAGAAGMKVVQDRCMGVEHLRLIGTHKSDLQDSL